MPGAVAGCDAGGTVLLVGVGDEGGFQNDRNVKVIVSNSSRAVENAP